ncbi:MAG: hypothetical protein JJU18_07665 [Oceanicaulis sp.]|nr:hypothetical protein [Oceanicaulis sp.]
MSGPPPADILKQVLEGIIEIERENRRIRQLRHRSSLTGCDDPAPSGIVDHSLEDRRRVRAAGRSPDNPDTGASAPDPAAAPASPPNTGRT